MNSHATHVYRGYRLQALYALHRILADVNTVPVVFQPEGKEDLSIIDFQGNLIEINQIKAYTTNLTLSDFSPEKPNSFFYRSAKTIKSLPNVRINIISYGFIGTELMSAIKESGPDRGNIAAKLASYGFISSEGAKSLLEAIDIQVIDEETIKGDIFKQIHDSCVGVDPEAAFDLLLKWLYDCSENREKIIRQNIIDKILRIGEFLTDRLAHLAEWGTSIVPIEDHEISEEESTKLDKEFYYGVSTVYDHILANLDIKRSARLKEISDGFKQSSVLIIHGASGQGKTALAYRYFHDAFPNQWRFRVRLIENRQHAIRVVKALNGHADSLGIPIAVYFDVTTKDADWPDFVREISLLPKIRLLVTIREEDWHRSAISNSMIRFSEIALNFVEEEARNLYQVLTNKQATPLFLGFEDAWNKFGGQGPLMEFVYLVKQGNTLRMRLAEQVFRLKEDVRNGKLQQNELSLIRLVSIATAYEARLQAKSLVIHLSLPAPDQTLQYFEDEYLLRLSTDRSQIANLHPIRSSILADLLSDSSFTPWIDSAKECISHIDKEDIEVFLLYSFLRRPEDAVSLYQFILSYTPRHWTAIAGITRALIWLGLSQYLESNHDLICELFNKFGSGWYLKLDFDMADVSPGVADKIMGTLDSIVGNNIIRTECKNFRCRQTEKSEIFKYAKEWLSAQDHEPCPPKTDLDWTSMSECFVWVANFGLHWHLIDWLSNIPFNEAIDTLPLSILSDVVYGLAFSCPAFFKEWMLNNRSKIVGRFRQETRIIALEDDGQKVTAHFIVGLESSGELVPALLKSITASKNRFHEETIIRIKLMSKLFPDRQQYASQGYGHKIFPDDPSWDDTHKTGIDKNSLPPACIVSVNSTFRILAERNFRPNTWPEYAQSIFMLRSSICNALLQLLNALENYFQSSRKLDFIGTYIDDADLNSCLSNLKHVALLPKCTLDEWGFVEEYQPEDVYNTKRNYLARTGLAIIQYRSFLDALKDYTSNLSNFFTQAQIAMTLSPLLGRSCREEADRERIIKTAEDAGIKTKISRLSVINLASAVKTIPRVQLEFDRFLGSFIDKTQLETFNRNELRLFQSLWNIWHVFVFNPEKVARNINSFKTWSCVSINKIRQLLRKEFKKFADDKCVVKIISEKIPWEGSPTLWVTINTENAFKPFEIINQIAVLICETIRSVPELRIEYISLYWDEIVVIPLLDGKSLSGTAWKWNILSILCNEKLQWFQLTPQLVPPNVLEELKIKRWEDPRLEPAQILLTSYSELSIYAKHIADFSRLPQEDLDEQGTTIMQGYLNEYSKKISSSCQTFLDSLSFIAERINILNEKLNDHPFLMFAALGLAELKLDEILPSKSSDNIYRLDLADFCTWEKQLEKIAQSIMVVYFCWISDVIGKSLGCQ